LATAVEVNCGARAYRRGSRPAGGAVPVEGNNCKIKHLKRLMYGRANFDLPRKMALLN
jgi:hypothetical protein